MMWIFALSSTLEYLESLRRIFNKDSCFIKVLGKVIVGRSTASDINIQIKSLDVIDGLEDLVVLLHRQM